MRPRGWHLPEKHALVGGEPIAGAFVDFGLYAFHCGRRLADRQRGLYLYLPKMEHHLEARLWNEVFGFTRVALGLPAGLIRATVLIEDAAGRLPDGGDPLRAARPLLWPQRGPLGLHLLDDQELSRRPALRAARPAAVKMTVPFMRAYSELLVRTCHARGAFAMGGMAALIPSRTDPEANQRAIDAVREDKTREANAGFDGTWVAHPDVVAVATLAFDEVLGSRPNQIDRLRDDVQVSPSELLDAASTPGEITEQGLRDDVSVAFQYISFWLGGRRRGRHQQHDGGRRDRGDLAIADLAVDPPRQGQPRARARGARRGDAGDPRPGG